MNSQIEPQKSHLDWRFNFRGSNPRSWIKNPGSWILDLKTKSLQWQSCIKDPESKIVILRFWTHYVEYKILVRDREYKDRQYQDRQYQDREYQDHEFKILNPTDDLCFKNRHTAIETFQLTFVCYDRNCFVVRSFENVIRSLI